MTGSRAAISTAIGTPPVSSRSRLLQTGSANACSAGTPAENGTDPHLRAWTTIFTPRRSSETEITRKLNDPAVAAARGSGDCTRATEPVPPRLTSSGRMRWPRLCPQDSRSGVGDVVTQDGLIRPNSVLKQARETDILQQKHGDIEGLIIDFDVHRASRRSQHTAGVLSPHS